MIRKIVKADEVFFVIDPDNAQNGEKQPSQLLASYRKDKNLLRWHMSNAGEIISKRVSDYNGNTQSAVEAGLLLSPQSTLN